MVILEALEALEDLEVVEVPVVVEALVVLVDLEAVEVPVILAGGLNSVNVAESIKQVQPYAVDVCSGVRTGGSLDSGKLQSFMSRVRGSAQ